MIWKSIKLTNRSLFWLMKEDWIMLRIVLFWYSLIPISNLLKYVSTDMFFINKYLLKSLLNKEFLLISFFKVWPSDFKISICKRLCNLSIVNDWSCSIEKILTILFCKYSETKKLE